MEIKNQLYLENSINSYLNTLKKDETYFRYYITNPKNLTKVGESIDLGFSCYALKIRYILNDPNLSEETKTSWASYINSFQKNSISFPDASYIDENFLYNHKKFSLEKSTKNIAKKILNKALSKNYMLNEQKLITHISAESKQAISTINEIDFKAKSKYTHFPSTRDEIYDYLDSFDWSNPWSAGAQFSSLCLFTKTQLSKNEETILYLKKYIKSKLNTDTGFYHTKKNIDDNVLINGAMKVITGLDWIDEEVHYPRKIIDYILNSEITNEACDLVDLVYVLFQSLRYVDHRKTEVLDYLSKVEDVIFNNFKFNEGAFSYSKNKSQKYYYGLNVTKEKPFADLHGTLLLLWAYTLILELKNENLRNWNIIKP